MSMYGFTVMHRSTREQPGKSRAVPFVRFCEGGKAISLGGQRPLVTDVDILKELCRALWD